MTLKNLLNIQALPNFQTLYQRLQGLATLDAILCEEWEMRYFSFDQHWGDSVNHRQAMASMRDGEGSHYFILFDENKNIIGKIFDNEIGHRNSLDVQQIAEFDYFLTEPAFINDEATWYFYRSAKNEQWQVFPQTNNLPFLGLLTNLSDYTNWANTYFGFEINGKLVRQIADFFPLTEDMILDLNPNRNFDTLREDLEEIGYPYDF